jgi:hypothetical protein
VTFVTCRFLYSEEFLVTAQPARWRTTPFRLPVTAYSIYLQLPSVSRGCLHHPQPQDASCRGDEAPTCRSNAKFNENRSQIRRRYGQMDMTKLVGGFRIIFWNTHTFFSPNARYGFEQWGDGSVAPGHVAYLSTAVFPFLGPHSDLNSEMN